MLRELAVGLEMQACRGIKECCPLDAAAFIGSWTSVLLTLLSSPFEWNIPSEEGRGMLSLPVPFLANHCVMYLV